MIFAAHSFNGSPKVPDNRPIHIWSGERIADLVVGLGLGDWVANCLCEHLC